MITKFKSIISQQASNIPGWKTNRKIVVFTSDDWGSIRMPSKEVYEKLLSRNIPVNRSVYDKYDTLEQREDMELLFNILSHYKDKQETHPLFTFNTVMGNPAFDQIKEDDFKRYYHEDFELSYLKYNNDNIFDLWHRAITEKLMHPQFHAREHVNVSLWMEALKKKQHETRIAFDHNFFGLKTNTPSPYQNDYLAAYWPSNANDFKQKISVLQDGLHQFEMKFGFSSNSFVACNYILPEEMERPLADYGVKYVQTQRGHLSPNINSGNTKIKRHFMGKSNAFNQLYLVRNCKFEPTLVRHGSDTTEQCLREVKTAFQWKKPAIISTHRINYVGGLAKNNRDKTLAKLEDLLTQILNKWPEVEFMSITELGNTIAKS